MTLQDHGPVAKSKKSKTDDHLKPQGKFDSTTNNAEQFRPYSHVQRAPKAPSQRKETVKNPPYEISEDDRELRTRSEVMEKYVSLPSAQRQNARSQKQLPKHQISRAEGSMENTSVVKATYQPIQAQRQVTHS